MPLKEIENRADVYTLVSAFYDRIKKDEFIGPIFLAVIPETKWEAHLQKLTDFWETNLFFVRKFKGNPMRAHKAVDAQFDYTISQKHFGKWMELWIATIDGLFSGAKAQEAKDRARKIGFVLFMRMFEQKPTATKTV